MAVDGTCFTSGCLVEGMSDGAINNKERELNDIIHPELRSLYGDPRAVDRRTFIVTSLSAGFAAAVLPVSAQTITTPADGLTAGEVKVPTKDGMMVAYRAMPAGRTNVPVILVVSEVWGAHEHIRDVARRFAKLGYYAIAPELFARAGDASKYTDTQALLKEIVAKTPDAQVMGDLDASVAFAKSEKADTSKLGITGFCWGGRITLLYAAHNPNVDAAVAWYGRATGAFVPGDKSAQDVAATDQGAGARPVRRRGCRHPERHGGEILRFAQGRGQYALGSGGLSRHAACVPRRLPADVPQGQGRGWLEARDRVVQAAPRLIDARARKRAAARPPVRFRGPMATLRGAIPSDSTDVPSKRPLVRRSAHRSSSSTRSM